MSDFVATRVEEETRLAKFYGIKKYFPMLNEHIIGTLLNQDPLIFCPRKGQGRSLIRSTFKYLLPEFLIYNPTKKRYINEEETETAKKKVLNSLNIIITFLNDRHPNFDRFWNFEYIKKYYDENLNRRESTLHDLIEFRRIILFLKII